MINRKKLYSNLTKQLCRKHKDKIIFPTTVVSIDFGTCSFNKNTDMLKSGKELEEGIDNVECVNDLGIHIYVNGNGFGTLMYFDENKPLESYASKIKKWLPEGCVLTAYNGYRMDFLLLERRFGIDLSKYILIDTMMIEKLFNYDNLRMLLCKNTDYPKVKLEYSVKKKKYVQSLNSLYLDYTGTDMYESVISKKHDSYVDALINFDVLYEQFYKYCFTCAEEMNEMYHYLISMEDEFNYDEFHLLPNTKFFKKINKEEYEKENGRIVINFGKYIGKTIDEINDNDLVFMLVKYNIPYKNIKHDPHIYELLYNLRLEWLKRLQKKREVA